MAKETINQCPQCGWNDEKAARLLELNDMTAEFGGRADAPGESARLAGRKMPATDREERTQLEGQLRNHEQFCGNAELVQVPATPPDYQEALEKADDDEIRAEALRRGLISAPLVGSAGAQQVDETPDGEGKTKPPTRRTQKATSGKEKSDADVKGGAKTAEPTKPVDNTGNKDDSVRGITSTGTADLGKDDVKKTGKSTKRDSGDPIAEKGVFPAGENGVEPLKAHDGATPATRGPEQQGDPQDDEQIVSTTAPGKPNPHGSLAGKADAKTTHGVDPDPAGARGTITTDGDSKTTGGAGSA